MNEELDHQLDNFTRKIVKESELESPSFDFTQNIMEQIEHETSSISTPYAPLISLRMWVLIFSILMLISIVTIVFGQFEPSLSLISEYQINIEIPEIYFSNTAIYTMGALGLLLLVQFKKFKDYFEKRLEY